MAPRPPIPSVSLFPPDFETSTVPVSPTPSKFPELITLSHTTNRISLVPLAASHIPTLFTHVGGPEKYLLYKYMPCGPFPTLQEFTAHIEWLIQPGSGFVNWAIVLPSGDPVGIISYLNIVPENHSIEIGHVLFSPVLQRTTEATEACWLLMRYAFELGFERVEWKCNDENKGSRRAAERLGFTGEGVFRRHMVVRGRRRDSWWGSVVVEEWVVVRKALEGWLSEGNFDAEGKQKRKVEEIRKEVEGLEREKEKGIGS
ncbi:hypothetical protein CJF32_00003661 [Rutstroemia sp. NJR-2017a WRK4]|nr:hypothetical protein CJF32_00003661 [Rutstroemia sp. NJR-2017a WRK4]